ncbi:MAG: beta-lactamase family protein [Acidobacteriota bacterium]|nr:beta-lactamase family protein [Acidobacteriota bacterium]
MKSEVISAFLSERIKAGDFPSAVYLVAEKGEVRFSDALGFAVKISDRKIPAQVETIYDLASLTKVLVTGLLCAGLVERGEIKLNDPVGHYLPGFQTAEKRHLTIRDLLTHVSGFSAWKPFYLLANRLKGTDKIENPKAEALGAIALEDLQNEPRTTVRYSDFNFLTLGFLIERIYKADLAEIARQEISLPLKLEQTAFNPAFPREQIAACEFGNEYEMQTCLEMGYEISNPHEIFRNRLIWGEVHDGNCYFLGGASGHAGLFSTAREVFKIALQFLPRTSHLLKPETCNLFKTNFTKNLNEARSFAFELAATENSTAGFALAQDSFGHLGFTGTSLWIEPARERIFILLTNRTHQQLPFVNINSTRRQFHDLASGQLGDF